MMHGWMTVTLTSIALGLSLTGCSADRKADSKTAATPDASAAPSDDPAYVLGYSVTTIDGESRSLADFKGQVVLVVNVASKCGLTPQYEGLEALYQAHKGQGLVVLGFPANNFNGQEPGTEAEIKQFCTSKYNVTFPMFSKVSVKGEDAHPLYRQLAELAPPAGGEPSWNFTKYLVDRQGRVIMRFDPRTSPNDPQMLAAIQQELAKS